ncbi:MAG TPA: hypothetical protein VGF79_11525 [Bacteroidia bacterium]
MRYSRGLNIELSIFSKDKGKTEKIKTNSSKKEPETLQASGEEIPAKIEEHKIVDKAILGKIETEGNAGVQAETFKDNKQILVVKTEMIGVGPVIHQDIKDQVKGNGTSLDSKEKRTNSSKAGIKKSKTDEPALTGAFGIIGFVLSLLGLICILVSFLLAILLLILGIVFSAIGMGKGRPNRELGIAGLVIGIVGILLMVLIVMYLFWVLLYI